MLTLMLLEVSYNETFCWKLFDFIDNLSFLFFIPVLNGSIKLN